MAHLSTLFSVVLCKKYNEKLYLKSKKNERYCSSAHGLYDYFFVDD
jgi:hypothetical protein